MDKIVQLDNAHHGAIRLLTGHGAPFGDAVNQAPVFVSEFEEAQRHYPILFRKDEQGALHALAILGFERDENLFLEGPAWDGYVPAILRRGPLMIGRGEHGEGAVLIDLNHPRVRDGGSEGMPLFREHGGDAPALEAAMAALHQVHLGLRNAERMQQLFEELALIEPIKLEVQVSDAKAINFEGFMAANGERIAGLSGEQLARLNEAGLLASAIFAASSLANMQRLIARKQRRDRAAQA
jgi:hypothetical protein